MTKYDSIDTQVSGADVEAADSTALISAKADADGEDISVTCRFKKVTATALTLVGVLAVLALAASRFSTGMTRPSSVSNPDQLGIPLYYACDGDNQCDPGLKCCTNAGYRGMSCYGPGTHYGFCPYGDP